MAGLTEAQRAEVIADIQRMEDAMEATRELELRARRRYIDTLYPDTGPLRRELYPKSMEFFAAGKEHRERAVIAANRVGKTEGMGGYEMTLHLTGRYPPWWVGRRFLHPVAAIAAGFSGETTKDIVQSKLLGKAGVADALGTGLIPGEYIIDLRRDRNLSDAYREVYVRHVTGGTSQLSFRAYQQGRRAMEGVERHVVWFDEEPPLDVWTEGVTRTMTVDGIVFGTFTPLEGMTATVLQFLEPELMKSLEGPNQ